MTGEELARLLEPTVEQLGYELADLELKFAGRDSLVRVFIDKPEGVGLEDCETVSRQVSAVLDVEDPVPGHYVLEVSSPGLDRKLTKPAHYRRYVGEEIRIQLRYPIEGRRKFRGRLKSAGAETIQIEVDGKLHELPIATIDTARLVPSL
jgi:ribosome maturation factor RimP